MKLEKYKYKLLIADFFTLIFTFHLTSFITSFLRRSYNHTGLEEKIIAILIFTFLAGVIVLIFQFNNLYKLHIFLSKTTQALKIIQSLIYGSLILIILSFFFKISIVTDSRIFIIFFLIISIFSVTFTRIFILRPIYLSRKSLYNRRILLAGTEKSALLIAAKFFLNDDLGANVIGYLSDKKDFNNKLFSKIDFLGTISDLEDVVNKYQIDEVIISLDEHNPEKILELIDKCNRLGISVKVSSDLFRIVAEKIEVENFRGVYLINATPRIDEATSIFFKRLFDFVVTLVAVIILSPILILIAIAIKLTSKGPIIFKQIRIGKDGKPFVFYKFRSMKDSLDNDKERQKMMVDFMKNNTVNNGITKIINEKRLTTIGKFIRKTSLDELPQLFNVLKGDMSLVGPRPCLPYEFENYDEWQKRRLSVIPGCTGVWQVYGRGKVSFFDSIILDIFYVNNMSPWFDLLLILKTLPVMIFGRGGK